MKAFLLAAGKGTRLKPYTDTAPKCLIPIQGIPLMRIWIDLMASHGIKEVLINTHHQAEKVESFVESIRSRVPVTITTVYEQDLLGSAGTIWKNREFVAGEEDFIIAYGDNLTDIDLTDMGIFHRECRLIGGVLTMGLFRAQDPRACGIAVLDGCKKIVDFIEKPQVPMGNLANGGIYIASSNLFDWFPKQERPPGDEDNVEFDFGFHVLPSLLGSMYGYEIKTYLRDIGTIQSYRAAGEEWPLRGNNR